MKLGINILPTANTYTLMVGDASQYASGTAINNPYLEITPPGFQKVTLIFSPNALNIYNSTSLKLTDTDCFSPLPDGIYKFRYSIAPNYDNYVDRSYFRVDQILERFDGAVLAADINACNGRYDEQYAKKLDEVEHFIQYAISAAGKCDDKLAIDSYKMALNLLNQLNC